MKSIFETINILVPRSNNSNLRLGCYHCPHTQDDDIFPTPGLFSVLIDNNPRIRYAVCSLDCGIRVGKGLI